MQYQQHSGRWILCIWVELSKSYLVMLQFSLCACIILLDLISCNHRHQQSSKNLPKDKRKCKGKYLKDCLFHKGTKFYWIISYNAAWQKVFEEHVFCCYCCSWKRWDHLVTCCNVWHRHACNCQPCLAKDINNKLPNPGEQHSIWISFCVNPHCNLGILPCHSSF